MQTRATNHAQCQTSAKFEDKDETRERERENIKNNKEKEKEPKEALKTYLDYFYHFDSGSGVSLSDVKKPPLPLKKEKKGIGEAVFNSLILYSHS